MSVASTGRSRGGGEAAWHAEAIVLRVAAAALYRLVALDTLLAWAAALPAMAPPADPCWVDRFGEVTERALRHAPISRTRCLFRALVRYAMLRRRGLDVGFVMGVRPSGAELTGHAWITLDGAPLFDDSVGAYVVTLRHPSESAS